MAYFNLVETRLDGPVTHVTGITDMDIGGTGGAARLFISTGPGGGVSTRSLAPGMGVLGVQAHPAQAVLGAPLQIEMLTLSGQPLLAVFGRVEAGLRGYAVGADGLPGTQRLLASGTEAAFSALQTVSFGDRTVLVTAALNGTALTSWIPGSGGQLTRLAQVAADAGQQGPALQGIGIAALAQVRIGTDSFVLSAAVAANRLAVHRLTADGALVAVSGIGAAEGLGIAAPSALAAVTLDGVAYAILAAAGSSSISVIRLGANGALSLADHVTDSLDTRFQAVTAMEAVSVSGRVFLIAGGGDDGLSLLTLLPGGRLVHLESIAETSVTVLRNVSALAAQAVGDRIDLFAAGSGKPGISRFSLDIGPLAPILTGGTGNDTLTGDARGDLIAGGEGDDVLQGGGGRDILIDGPGTDRLWGGTGADTFVLGADGAPDTVQDFDIAEDRLDLAGWGMLYDVRQLDIRQTATGAQIRFGTELVTLVTPGNLPLAPSQLTTAHVVNLQHSPVALHAQGPPATRDALTGGAGADTLRGQAGDDTLTGLAGDDLLEGGDGNDVLSGGTGRDRLFGGEGDDTLNGGAGGDVLDGGAGIDTVSYEGSTAQHLIDLLFPQFNQALAAGDTYAGIENILGSEGMDDLRGTQGDNVLTGGRNVDMFYGRGGNDTMYGGFGNDVMMGGPGADLMVGQDHRDQAAYYFSTDNLTLDLQYVSRNTFEATGDRYDSIEDLAGGFGGDQIAGDAGDNGLYGREGADALYGRLGNDYLNGGAHDDRLDGGPGNDTLRGGMHADTFVFNGGRDVIEDFRFTDGDRIAIDRTMTGGPPAQPAALMAMASVTGGQVVFDFGAGNTLTIQNLTSLAGLENNLFGF